MLLLPLEIMLLKFGTKLPVSLDKFCRLLNYQFKDTTLLELALTHRSVSSKNNERLEFLGDAILGFVIADLLFQRFPRGTEGELTRLRASLVKGDTLAEVGLELSLGDYLRLGSGELKSGGFRRASILACGVEAILGAVSLDGGYDEARELIKHLFKTRLESTSPDIAVKDPKTQLQEFLQGRKRPLPVYELLRVEGESHEQSFFIECHVEGLTQPMLGSGASRRRAEQVAAKAAYDLLSEK